MKSEQELAILQLGKDMKTDEFEQFLKSKLEYFKKNKKHAESLGVKSGYGYTTALAQLSAMQFIMGSFLKEFKGQPIQDYEWE